MAGASRRLLPAGADARAAPLPIFVHGELLSGTDAHAAVVVARGGAAVYDAALRGAARWPAVSRLWRTPSGGALLSADPSGVVFGELFDVDADDYADQLRALDAHWHHPRRTTRRAVRAALASGDAERDAWAYFARGDPEEADRAVTRRDPHRRR
eukprot:gene164-14464_t